MTEDSRREKQLSKALTHVLEECRMVLPGIQALFGFQLIAVFNAGFDKLSAVEQALHLAAIVLVALAIALVMTPAAYHRQRIPEGVSEHFILLASKLLLLSMVPLALATTIEVYLIARLVLDRSVPAAALALSLAGTFVGLWLVLPRRHHRASGTERSRGRPARLIQPATQG